MINTVGDQGMLSTICIITHLITIVTGSSWVRSSRAEKGFQGIQSASYLVWYVVLNIAVNLWVISCSRSQCIGRFLELFLTNQDR